jgi:hypothetical protein
MSETEPLFRFSRVYVKNRQNVVGKLRKKLTEIEDEIRANPQTAGRRFKGKRFSKWHHSHVDGNCIVIYIICKDARKGNAEFQKALSRQLRAFRLCEWCDLTCIEIDENTTVFLTILTHSEQNRFFGGS